MKGFTAVLKLCLIGLVVASGPASTAAAGLAAQENLLTNPGFEGSYVLQCCHTEPGFAPGTPYAEVQVAPGWTAWWVEPDSSPAFPSYCDYRIVPETCQPYHRPEFRDLATAPERIRSGSNAQKYFTFYSVHLAGLYQQVSGVAIGQKYRFSAYMHAWSTNSDVPGAPSSGQPSMGMRVGIDPNGGTNPFSPSIVWGPQFTALDAWHQFSVDAVAASSTITVFTRSQPQLAWRHNDVYMDDASLAAIGPGAGPLPTLPSQATGQNVSPTPGSSPTAFATLRPPTPTWPATNTPLASGEVWYTVRSGDTLVVIAFYHKTTADEIKRLNALDSNTIYPGQKLLIGHVAPPAPSTETPGPTFTPSLTPELVLPPTRTPAPVSLLPNYGQLCVIAYNDVNNNAVNDNESSLAGVRVTISVGNTPLDGYLTTEAETTHCFQQLPPGNYTVSVAVPAGYTTTTTSEASVQLEAGRQVTLAFGVTAIDGFEARAEAMLPRLEVPLLLGGMATLLVGTAGIIVLILTRKKQ